MARLVSPGYSNSVLIGSLLAPNPERIIEFKGLNRQRAVAEGEMSDMLNMTSDNYPLLTPRKARGYMPNPPGVIRPLRLMSKFDRIAMIARLDTDPVTTAFYYNGTLVPAVDDLSESSRMVAINTKICFFPEKTYLEIAPDRTIGEYGSLEAVAEETTATVTISLDEVTISLTDNPGFKYDDAVNIVGTLTYGSDQAECNVSVNVEDADEHTLYLPQGTFLELIGSGVSSASFNGIISREMPDLDHVVEWNNRLWGLSSADNTVYACKLGDPTNWQYFQGTSLDSYFAQQGTDGAWTGMAVYSNHLICFKEDSICRIYGTAPSNYQVTNTEAFGVETGSPDSVITINDTVFYKSKIGIMAYSGGIPECISDKLAVKFKNVVAGTEKRKYYASIKTPNGYELMVFDTEKGVWHKEDDMRFRSCATIGDKLYFVNYLDDMLVCSEDLMCDEMLFVGSDDVAGRIGIVNPATPEEDASAMDWMAVFGPFDEWIEEKKIYSKLALRIISKSSEDNYLTDENDEPLMTEEGELLVLPNWLRVYISIDEGEWELVQNYEPASTKGDFIPIIPRRCDRYSVKVEGKGPYEIKTLTRRVRQGTFLRR